MLYYMYRSSIDITTAVLFLAVHTSGDLERAVLRVLADITT